jgi:hypothetical protein
MNKKAFVLSVVLLLLSLAFTLPAVAQDSSPAVDTAGYAAFLDRHHGIRFEGEVPQAAYTDALTAIFGAVELPEGVDADGFSLLEAITTTLFYANLDEVAGVLSDDSAAALLAGYPSALALDAAQQRFLAAAASYGLLDSAFAEADFAQPVSGAVGTFLLGRTLEVKGRYENFLGYVSDPEIYARVVQVWQSFDQVAATDLQAAAVQLIRDGIISGYNLKRLSSDPGFDPALTINYGHANIDHALQLIGLLNSLGIDAKVQLEPKTSAFLSLAEWGGSPPTQPELQSDVLDDGNWITYAKEYDLLFEFQSVEDRDQFDSIIRNYATRNDNGIPYLARSFRVPLYSARVDLGEGYQAVYNHVAYQDQFYIQSFSLIDNLETTKAAFEAAFPDARHEIWEDLWVNVSFYNYLIQTTAS